MNALKSKTDELLTEETAKTALKHFQTFKYHLDNILTPLKPAATRLPSYPSSFTGNNLDYTNITHQSIKDTVLWKLVCKSNPFILHCDKPTENSCSALALNNKICLPWSNCFWMLSWSVLFPLTRYRPSVHNP